MLTEINQIISIAANICIIFLSIGFVMKFYQAKKYLYYYMDIESLLKQNGSTEVVATQDNKQDNIIRERLTLAILSGKNKEYLGKNYSVDEIEKHDEKETNKLFTRYEATLGRHNTKLIKEEMISVHTKAVELACPVISQGRLAVSKTNEMCESLNKDPFIDLALTPITSKIYHEYGQFLAPLVAALITSKFVKPVDLQLPAQGEQKTQQQLERFPKISLFIL